MSLDALRYFGALARTSLGSFARQAIGDVTLADLAARWARRRPDALALEASGQKLSYRELDAVVVSAGHALHALGARGGDVVALIAHNSLAYVALLLAGARTGITLALVHPELAGEPLAHALSVSRATHALCELSLLEQVKSVTSLPCSGFEPERREPFTTSSRPLAFAADRGRRDFALVFTSGTTGMPKACRLPHSRVLAAACLFGAPLYDFRETDKLLCALPLHHGSPLMLGLGACLVMGAPLVLERRFSARDFLAAARRSGATAFLYVGDLGRLLLATPESSLDRAHRLRLAVGNGMSAEVWPKLQARFGVAQVREFYAATESPVGIFNWSGRVGSVGNLPYAWMFGLKLVRVDDEGWLVRDARGRLCECAADEPGELLVRARRSGLGVYHGYVDAAASEARLVRDAFRAGDAFFRTFDILRRDRAGFYYFVERAGESYRFKGENVSATQVERELLRVPGVREALVSSVVVPGYDGRAGSAVLVVSQSFTVEGLLALAARLPRSALPRFVRATAELSRTSSLKRKRGAGSVAEWQPAAHREPSWLWDGSRYRPLDDEAYRGVLSGTLRL